MLWCHALAQVVIHVYHPTALTSVPGGSIGNFVVEKLAPLGQGFVWVFQFSPCHHSTCAPHSPIYPQRLIFSGTYNVVNLKNSSVFWDVMQRILVVVYRNFGTASRSHSQTPKRCTAWSMKRAPMPETSVNKYPHTLRNILEQRRPQLYRGKRLKFCTVKKAQTRILKSPNIYLDTVLSYLEMITLIFKVFLWKAQSSIISFKFRNVLRGPLGGCDLVSC